MEQLSGEWDFNDKEESNSEFKLKPVSLHMHSTNAFISFFRPWQSDLVQNSN